MARVLHCNSVFATQSSHFYASPSSDVHKEILRGNLEMITIHIWQKSMGTVDCSHNYISWEITQWVHLSIVGIHWCPRDILSILTHIPWARSHQLSPPSVGYKARLGRPLCWKFQLSNFIHGLPGWVAQSVNNWLAIWDTRVRSLGQEDPLEKEMTTHSSILAWRIPWTVEPGRLQSMGSKELDMTLAIKPPPTSFSWTLCSV